jgi:hypothetical protein
VFAKQEGAFDEHQRAIFTHSEINDEWTHDDSANLHPHSGQSVGRLSSLGGIALESFHDLPEGRSHRFSSAGSRCLALELTKYLRVNKGTD